MRAPEMSSVFVLFFCASNAQMRTIHPTKLCVVSHVVNSETRCALQLEIPFLFSVVLLQRLLQRKNQKKKNYDTKKKKPNKLKL